MKDEQKAGIARRGARQKLVEFYEALPGRDQR